MPRKVPKKLGPGDPQGVNVGEGMKKPLSYTAPRITGCRRKKKFNCDRSPQRQSVIQLVP